jgi:predicted alpha/beta hydrolase family esterase
MRVIIIHGAYGHPQENWFPWLREKLENLGHQVITPHFPTPKGQSLKNWLKILDREVKTWNSDIILVGHSLGPALILNKLEELKKPIKAAFLVSGFVAPIGIKKFDSINTTFFEKGFNWQKIKKNCHNFFVYHGDNDPYVPLAMGQNIAENLGVKLKIIYGGGHLNEAAGFSKFPRLLKDLKKVLW